MKIKDILAVSRPTLSFEVFPPKRELPVEPARAVVRELSRVNPAFVSVTYGAAGGDNSLRTAEMAAFLEHDCHIPALAHLTCVMATRESVDLEVQRLRELGVENILALRGDRPVGEVSSPGQFHYASELVSYLRKIYPEASLGGACYPEGHVECEHLDDDIANLKRKVDAGLDFLTTQMFFDNDIYFRYLSRLRNAGITVPVLAGIMPVTNSRQIKRICELSGTRLPPRFRAIVDRFGNNPAAMLDAGVAYATEQIIDLYANGACNVHVYTMNRPEVALKIADNLKHVLA